MLDRYYPFWIITLFKEERQAMPFKHEVIDSRGETHSRISQNRQYAFAIVTFCKPMERTDSLGIVQTWPARSHCSWSMTKARANNAARYAHGYWGFESVE